MRKVIFAVVASAALSGCMYHVKSVGELRNSGPSNQQIFSMDYQKLAYCVDVYGTPIIMDMQRSSSTTIYDRLRVAEIVTGYSLLELKGLDDGRTLARSYDGEVHRDTHRDWFKVMAACAKGELKLPG